MPRSHSPSTTPAASAGLAHHVHVAALPHPTTASTAHLPAIGPAPALDLAATGIPGTPGTPAPFAAGPGLFDALVDLAGPGGLTLHQILALWQREQDRILNRAWRRPGGLARSPAP